MVSYQRCDVQERARKGAFLLRLVPEQAKSTVDEVHDRRDDDESYDVRHQSLKQAEACANHEQKERLHIQYDVRPIEPDCRRERGRSSCDNSIHELFCFVLIIYDLYAHAPEGGRVL